MLQDGITANELCYILSNHNLRKQYLTALFAEAGRTDRIARGTSELIQQIIETWDYPVSKEVLREMFRASEKYAYQQTCCNQLDLAIEDWQRNEFGAFEWPFSAMAFDEHVHRLNRDAHMREEEKDQLLSQQVIKFRRIKHINQLRNDFIEFLIFQNENVIPTFGNRSGVDFFINGEAFDQKVAKSVGASFVSRYGPNYREIAIARPELVARSLYENQDEARFGSDPRLYIIYLDGDINSRQIQEQISAVDFNNPQLVEFDYCHSGQVHHYQTKCFTILLHN